MKSDKTRAEPSARGGSFEGRGALSESDNKVFSFGIGGFSQRHSPSSSAGTETPTPTATALRFSRTQKSAGGTPDKSKVDAPMAFLRDLDAYDCREDWQRTAVEAGRSFLHDIDAFVHASPST